MPKWKERRRGRLLQTHHKPDALASASADGQQDFLAEGILELLELQSRLTFVAEYFEHGGPALFRHFHAPVFEMDDVHLQRLDLKIPVVAAMWTSQRHERTPLLPGTATDSYLLGVWHNGQSLILCNGRGRRNEKRPKNARSHENGRKSVKFGPS